MNTVNVRYWNHRGEIAWRTILPVRLWFGECEHYPEPQWLLDCIDSEKGERTFAMKDILVWTPTEVPP